ncbi:hypothetical protein, partial [Burkholderia ubonensis]|uniref:hypothetical protein n=1 Tax=Burkholderia ubonensis TaxID=101571 RepID=UPI001E465DB4
MKVVVAATLRQEAQRSNPFFKCVMECILRSKLILHKVNYHQIECSSFLEMSCSGHLEMSCFDLGMLAGS